MDRVCCSSLRAFHWKLLHLLQDRRVEEVRRLQVRLEEQEERNKTLRDVNAELRRQLLRHESATGANERPILTRIDGRTEKKVSEARSHSRRGLMIFSHVTLRLRKSTQASCLCD